MKSMVKRVTAAGRMSLHVAGAAALLSSIAYAVGYPMLSPPIGASIFVCLRHPDAISAQPKRMIASLLHKLGATNRREAAALAARHGLV